MPNFDLERKNLQKNKPKQLRRVFPGASKDYTGERPGEKKEKFC